MLASVAAGAGWSLMHALVQFSAVLNVKADESYYDTEYSRVCPKIPVIRLIGDSELSHLSIYQRLQQVIRVGILLTVTR
jgi:hypothetical protein